VPFTDWAVFNSLLGQGYLLDGLDQTHTMGKLAPHHQHGMIGQNGALALLHDGNLARNGLLLA
jgi:hypothetical protein